MKMKNLMSNIVLSIALSAAAFANAATPVTSNGVTTIHLDEFNGYFAARETLAELKPGQYEFIINNKSGKLVGFRLQDGETHKFLDKFPLEPGQTRKTRVTIGENGFRYRCPINPTPWYDVSISN